MPARKLINSPNPVVPTHWRQKKYVKLCSSVPWWNRLSKKKRKIFQVQFYTSQIVTRSALPTYVQLSDPTVLFCSKEFCLGYASSCFARFYWKFSMFPPLRPEKKNVYHRWPSLWSITTESNWQQIEPKKERSDSEARSVSYQPILNTTRHLVPTVPIYQGPDLIVWWFRPFLFCK